jgi:hypothetical protein
LVPEVGLYDCKLGMLDRDVVYVGHQVAAWTLPTPFVLRLGPQRDSTIERVCADLPDVLIPPRPARPITAVPGSRLHPLLRFLDRSPDTRIRIEDRRHLARAVVQDEFVDPAHKLGFL